jgi:signal peptidase I
VLAFLCFIPVLVLQISLLVGYDVIGPGIIVLALFVSVILPLVAVIDSYYVAAGTRSDYRLKEYNRWYVYALLVLMATGSSTQMAFNVRANYFEAFRIPTMSMYPTLVPEDRFLANKIAYDRARPKRGDVVVFVNPEDRKIRYIKRIVAVAGDTVRVQDGEVYVNGQRLQRSDVDASMLNSIPIEYDGRPVTGRVFEEVNEATRYKILLADAPLDKGDKDMDETEVPKSHCFVLGDNRCMSKDSRHFGPIPLADVIGRVDYLYFPSQDWSRFGRVDH